MKLSQFKKDCEAVGLDWKLVKKRVEESGDEFARALAYCDEAAQVVHEWFDWPATTEGYHFWEDMYDKLQDLRLIAEEGEVGPFRIHGKGKDWEIDDTTVTRKQRLKLFKLLADDLGYDITD